jgi:hypothetical protein
MSHELNYYICRVEHGLSAAEQRAADQRLGEVAAALADLSQLVARSLGRGLRVVPGLGRVKRPGIGATVAVARPGRVLRGDGQCSTC